MKMEEKILKEVDRILKKHKLPNPHLWKKEGIKIDKYYERDGFDILLKKEVKHNIVCYMRHRITSNEVFDSSWDVLNKVSKKLGVSVDKYFEMLYT